MSARLIDRPLLAPPARRGYLLPRIVAALALAFACGAHADDGLAVRLRSLEAGLHGHPQRARSELAALAPSADAAPAAQRRYAYALYGQAHVLTGNTADAADLADRLADEAARTHDPATEATALLIRGAIESAIGDAARSAALAREAHALAVRAGDNNLRYWAALSLGTTARTRGHTEAAMASLQEALSLADAADDAYRRSSVLYQLAWLQHGLRNGPAALAASLAAYRDGEAARSAYAMANARMAESGVMELLGRPARELAAMEEALAIARTSRSEVAEARALVNLSDIRLRRKQHAEALDLARRSLSLARTAGDPALVATSKANAGFALLGLSRVAEGKRLVDEAVTEYERTGATAEIAELVGEYGRGLEQVGDFKGALALFHRERKLNDEIAIQTRQRALLEVQEKYETDRRNQEIALLARENEVKTAEIANRVVMQRIWWLLAGLFAISFAVVTVLYRKLRQTNALLAGKNAELSVQSTRDPLTALYNRRYFQSFVASGDAHRQPRRGHGDNLASALLLIDIDHFKETNDRFGHAIGDAVLVAVSDRLRATLRDTDIVVRWGGEEFLVYATTGADRVDDIAARILRAISAQPITLDGQVVRTTMSIGYMAMPLPPATTPLSWDRAIGLVDMALYMAKVNGRNRAYGIKRLVRDDDEVLAAAERDLEHAWQSGLVELHVLYGPSPASGVSANVSTFEDADPPRAAGIPASRRPP
ncbi:MAG: GGDEF domain-containing protein [Burkholderiales bacterium]|nr:GGDEF domain-containing protein [Burkholderiales bacterium]